MPKLRNPFIRIRITEVIEGAPGDSLRECSYKLVEKDFQTREDVLVWTASQNFYEDIVGVLNINI